MHLKRFFFEIINFLSFVNTGFSSFLLALFISSIASFGISFNSLLKKTIPVFTIEVLLSKNVEDRLFPKIVPVNIFFLVPKFLPLLQNLSYLKY